MIETTSAVLTSMPFLILWIALTVYIPWHFRSKGTQEGQMLATGFGILGTFLGIVGGLLTFDTANIDQSVPELLDGLSLAFLTSIAGMGFSMLIGLYPKKLGFESDSVALKDKTETELLAEVLHEIQAMNRSIAGEGDGTLVTQIQKLRMSVNDRQDDMLSTFNSFAENTERHDAGMLEEMRSMKVAFDDFATKMAENNMKALIEAIQQVMQDFNAKINDQLGQSFKDLNTAVTQLVEWQKEYRVLVQESGEVLQVAAQTLTDSSESMNSVAASVAGIAADNENIQTMQSRFTDVVTKLNDILTGTVTFADSLATVSRELETNGHVLQDEVRALVQGTLSEMKSASESISEQIRSTAETASRHVQEKNADALEEMKQLTYKVLESFGQNIASISGKMATDFARMQEALAIRR